MTGDAPQDGFLSRWSSRKPAAKIDAPEAPLAAPAPVEASPAPRLSEEEARSLPEAEILARLELPTPESIVRGADIQAFLRSDVPAVLRNRALRALWRSDPVFANLDGLNDYEEDYSDAAKVVKGMKTVYQVGKGMLRDLIEDEDPAPAQPAPVAEAPVAEAAEPATGEPEAGALERAENARAGAPEAVEAAQKATEPIARPRRAMGFQFSDGTKAGG